MSMFKKITSSIVATAMTLSVFFTSAFASLPTDIINTDYKDAVSLLSVLDIMVGDKDTGMFRPDDTIIRSEAARVAISALGLQKVASSTSGTTKYTDVPEGHWATGYINVATQQGMVIGDDVGTFRPDSDISYQEMVTIMVRALGYEPMAKSKGGYPTGYLVTASNIGLTDDVSGVASEGITRGNVAKLVFNALTINMMEQKGFGQDINYEIGDNTLLEDYLDVIKVTGQVQAVGLSALDGASSLEENKIMIGDKVYKTGDADVRQILGFNVDAYVTNSKNASDRTLLVAIPVEGENEVVSVNAENIEEIVKSPTVYIRYWLDKETDKNTKKANISSSAKVLYNGKVGTMDDVDFITDGAITLLDSDANGDYDVVFVNETTNYVVEEVVENTHKIVDKYGNPTLVLDPEDTSIQFSINKGSEKITLKDLKEWDVLTVTKSKDGDFIYIEVSNEKVSGTVTEKDDEKVYIGGTGYKIASNYQSAISLNDKGTFYLDVHSKIAAVDAESTVSENYAYLNEIEMTNNLNKTFDVELFTKDGEVKNYTSHTKIKVNGSANLTALEAKEAIGGRGQLITFELNSEGKINKITTATDTSGAIDEDNFSKNLSIDGAVFKKSSSKLTGNGKSITVGKDTIVFDIPEGSTKTTDYKIGNSSYFVNDDEYDVIAFDMKEDLTASVIMVTSSNGEADEASSILVVDKITKVEDEDGNPVEKLYAYQDGKLVTLVTEEEDILVKTSESGEVSLKQGDIIQVRLNASGKIEKISLVFDISSKAEEKTNVISEDSVTYYGKVVKKFSDSFNHQVAGGEVMNFKVGNANIYRVDTTKNTKQITVGDIGDIQKYDESAPELVFVRVYEDEVKDIIVVK